MGIRSQLSGLLDASGRDFDKPMSKLSTYSVYLGFCVSVCSIGYGFNLKTQYEREVCDTTPELHEICLLESIVGASTVGASTIEGGPAISGEKRGYVKNILNHKVKSLHPETLEFLKTEQEKYIAKKTTGALGLIAGLGLGLFPLIFPMVKNCSIYLIEQTRRRYSKRN